MATTSDIDVLLKHDRIGGRSAPAYVRPDRGKFSHPTLVTAVSTAREVRLPDSDRDSMGRKQVYFLSAS